MQHAVSAHRNWPSRLFALLLLIVGMRKRTAPARYAGLGLLGITVVKLFFHDLFQLDQLYRIGAFIVVAVIAIVASFCISGSWPQVRKTMKPNLRFQPLLRYDPLNTERTRNFQPKMTKEM